MIHSYITYTRSFNSPIPFLPNCNPLNRRINRTPAAQQVTLRDRRQRTQNRARHRTRIAVLQAARDCHRGRELPYAALRDGAAAGGGDDAGGAGQDERGGGGDGGGWLDAAGDGAAVRLGGAGVAAVAWVDGGGDGGAGCGAHVGGGWGDCCGWERRGAGWVRMGCVSGGLGGTYRAAAAARRRKVKDFMVALGGLRWRKFDSV
jgi:hypothetical protein